MPIHHPTVRVSHDPRANYAASRVLGRAPGRAGTIQAGRTIATQYGSSAEQKQQYFGRPDPFCMFAVVPIVIVAGVLIWSELAILGVPLIFVALLIVLADSWANRPIKKSAPRYREDY